MTLKEIAAIAGVSPAAVSRYLNGGSLSAAKREAIQNAIEETDFRPNRLAHNLRTGHVNQVGVIVPKIHSESVSEVLSGINSVLSKRGYLTVLGSTEGDSMTEYDYLELMQSYHLAGIILMAATVTPEREDLYMSCQVPLVITGQNFPSLNCVYHDDYHTMKELGSLLTKRGRKHIAYIGVNEADPAVGAGRRRGAQDALTEAGLDGADMIRTVAEFSAGSGYERMKELLAEHPEIDGVLCATDSIAQGAMHALKEAGRRIPEDVSIAGVGSDWTDVVSTPPLTTAKLYQTQCGRNAAQILLEMIDSDLEAAPARKTMLGFSIVERESV